jgi:hypothetical protein
MATRAWGPPPRGRGAGATEEVQQNCGSPEADGRGSQERVRGVAEHLAGHDATSDARAAKVAAVGARAFAGASRAVRPSTLRLHQLKRFAPSFCFCRSRLNRERRPGESFCGSFESARRGCGSYPMATDRDQVLGGRFSGQPLGIRHG